MTKYEIKRFSSLERRLYDDSEKKKDSGFGWGKALGATAAVAGTMYGAKKGMFGNTVRRGFNTAYGQLGNTLGSQSMVNSAARDWAIGSVKNPGSKGSKMQYNRDIINKQNEFKSQFNKNLTSSNTSSNVNNSSTTTTKQQKPKVESVMKPVEQSSSLTAQQRREQRLATTGAGNYQAAKDLGFKTEKTVRHKITPQEKARRTQEYNQRVQANKNKKNAGLMGVSSPDSNTFYATPNMFEQRTMSDSRYRRKYFSIMLNLFR